MKKENYKPALEKMLTGTREERVFLAEHSFGLFCLYYFSHYFKYALADYHYVLFEDFEDLINCKIRELVWVIYREGGKTTLEKLGYIWVITYKKRMYPNADAFEKENSERILFDIAFELVNNKRFQQDFGVLFSKEKSVNEIKQNRINNFITQNGVRVEAHSTQESVRGRLHLAQRPDFLSLDDFETNKTKDSKAYTKQVNDHITEAMAGLAPNGCILYCCNYLSEYGNVQWLLNRAKDDTGIRVRNIPVVLDTGLPAWEAKYALTDEEAKKTGKVSIEDKKRQLGSLVFSYEMMNKPIDEMLAEFKKEYVQVETEDAVKKLDTNCFITIDSAVKKTDEADFTGVTINRVSTQNKWYIKTYRLKVNSKELIDHLFYLKKEYSPMFIGLEETTFTMAIQPFLEDEMRKRNIFFSVTPVKHRGVNKETRIRGLIPRWENKSIFLVGDNPELLDEMRTFPNGQNDDVLDSCLVSDTKILTKNGYKNISDIQIGDMVMTRVGYNKVIFSGCTGVKDVISNIGLVGTKNHPVITKKGEKDLCNVSESDILYIWNEKLSCIEEKSIIDTQNQSSDVHDTQILGKRKVYNIEVENEHEYIANGVLVHNCSMQLPHAKAPFRKQSIPREESSESNPAI